MNMNMLINGCVVCVYTCVYIYIYILLCLHIFDII